MSHLPHLSDEPTRYPGCCLSLSNPLLATIKTLLSPSHDLPHSTNITSNEPALLLSIGSGTGLLEELLHIYLNHDTHAHAHAREGRLNSWRVEGVEVNPAVNIHLPEDRINHVAGTWAVLGTRAREAAALMFVYPRDGALVRRYVETFMDESGVGSSISARLVLWLGPKCDWEDTGLRSCCKKGDGDGLEILEMRDGAGLAGYEMLAVLRRMATAFM